VGSPHLYTLVSEVQSGGEVSDSVNTSIGIRSIKYTGDGGFFVSAATGCNDQTVS
jgi:beta-galactosidase/beta-glucuronidase